MTANQATATRLAPAPVIVAIAAAWTVTITAYATGAVGLGRHDHLAGGAVAPWTGLLVFLLAWQLMLAAMMLPAALPVIRRFVVVAGGQPRPAAATTAFLAGYGAVWSAVAVLAFGGDLALHRIFEASGWSWLATRTHKVAPAVLFLAGAFQLSPFKDRCLDVCRRPDAYLLSHYRRGAAGSFQTGAGHAVFCVGCCWALMLVALAVGVAGLIWMVALTGVMVVERTAGWGRSLVVPIGLALMALGVLALAVPAWFGRGIA